jgi:hypothetical protein
MPSGWIEIQALPLPNKKYLMILCHDFAFQATIDCYERFRFWGSLMIWLFLARRRAAGRIARLSPEQAGLAFRSGLRLRLFFAEWSFIAMKRSNSIGRGVPSRWCGRTFPGRSG